MTCQQVQVQLSLYLYGELEFAEEEQIEEHLLGCAYCQQALAREKHWHANLKSEQLHPPHDLLIDCRRDLRTKLASAAKQTVLAKRPWWTTFHFSWGAQAAGIALLMMAGFSAGRLTGHADLSQAGFLGAPATRVRDVRPAPDGSVRIIIEQVRESEIAGNLNDPRVRKLVLAGAQEHFDPAVRVESVQVLQRDPAPEVLSTLASLARQDPNAAVRLKAVEGLRPHVAEEPIRATLTWVLQRDQNPAVRSEAIDALVSSGQNGITPEMVNMLRSVAQADDSDDYVRFRCFQILQEVNAPANTY